MPGSYVVVVGGSAGAVDALVKLVSGLPSDFAAAICVAIHYPPNTKSTLPEILRRAGSLPAFHAGNRERVAPGRIYVAPPGSHLTFSDGETRVIDGPRENWHRPSVDVLFRSAAEVYNTAAIGVIISGMLDDGSAGLAAIKAHGGTGIAQDPGEATFPDMPRNAISSGSVDYVLRVEDIPRELQRLVERPIAQPPSDLPMLDTTGTGASDYERDQPSTFTCPECGGTLFDVEQCAVPHYRCRVGHAYSPHVLLASQSEHLEAALWTALRSVEEQAELSRRLAMRSRASKLDRAADQMETRAQRLRECGETIHKALHEGALRDEAVDKGEPEQEKAEGV